MSHPPPAPSPCLTLVPVAKSSSLRPIIPILNKITGVHTQPIAETRLVMVGVCLPFLIPVAVVTHGLHPRSTLHMVLPSHPCRCMTKIPPSHLIVAQQPGTLSRPCLLCHTRKISMITPGLILAITDPAPQSVLNRPSRLFLQVLSVYAEIGDIAMQWAPTPTPTTTLTSVLQPLPNQLMNISHRGSLEWGVWCNSLQRLTHMVLLHHRPSLPILLYRVLSIMRTMSSPWMILMVGLIATYDHPLLPRRYLLHPIPHHPRRTRLLSLTTTTVKRISVGVSIFSHPYLDALPSTWASLTEFTD